MTILTKLAASLLVGGVITGALALGLIATNRPIADLRAEGQGTDQSTDQGTGQSTGQSTGQGLDFSVIRTDGPSTDLQTYTARDGADLGFRRWDSGRADAPLLVAVHGSGWHGAQFEALGAALAAQGLADVLASDLRGHGPAPQRRGDVDYIGQFEDDLADLIAQQARDGQRVVMLGHSSGGGLVIRFAGGVHGGLLDGAVLLAPFVQHDAPTTRPQSGGWARVMTRRIIGLSMLNMAGITGLNHLPIIQFSFPDAVLDGPLGHTATRAYSFRLNASYAPRQNWQADIRALPPFLLVAGERDEAFVAPQYASVFAAITNAGRYALVPAGHLDVVDASETRALIAEFLTAR